MEPGNIELQLWEYIDGICDAGKKAHIEYMLSTDPQWQHVFQQLSALHASSKAEKELEQPSMRFTKNVMDAIAQISIAAPARRYLNSFVIRLIAACFVLSIALVLGYAIVTRPHGSGLAFTPDIFAGLFSSNTINILISVNVITLLLLVDTLLRKRKVFRAN
ncbi:MAG: hypothetical protein ACTHJ0_10450 [Flavipsychrobacter sp.]